MIVSFFCDRCKIDMDLNAFKSSYHGEEYFYSKCSFCHGKVVRHITKKETDPYFRRSRKVIVDRKKMSRDLLQPWQDGFRTYYQKEWEKIDKASQEYDRKQQDAVKKRQEWYNKNSSTIVERERAKKVIEIEEKMAYGG